METDHKLAILIKSINNTAVTFYFLFKIGMEIIINEVRVMLGGNLLLDNITITMGHDEQWAITGPSGSGKSTLAKAITGKIFHRGMISFDTIDQQEVKPTILLIEQQHQFANRSNVQQFYYQQRFNSSDAEDSLTVAEQFDNTDEKPKEYWINFFNLMPIINKPLIQLSNGENKRLQLAKAMTQSPSLLILDNPFVGLDKEGRTTLKEGLNKIVQAGTKILLFAATEDLPSCITHVAQIKKGKIIFGGPKDIQPKQDELLETDAMVLSPVALKKIYASSNLTFKQAPLLFHNEKGKKFNDVSKAAGMNYQIVGRGAAYGDIDSDGDLDIGVVDNNGKFLLLRNDGGNNNSWIKLRLVGEKTNRNAIGARVIVKAGGIQQQQYVRSGGSFLSESERTLTFGLGGSAKVDSIEVIWPGGTSQVLPGTDARSTYLITEGKGLEKR